MDKPAFSDPDFDLLTELMLRQFERIDQSFERVEGHLGSVESRLHQLEADVREFRDETRQGFDGVNRYAMALDDATVTRAEFHTLASRVASLERKA